jgi:alpha-tubulin suppressor-like RCC1 family protein
MAPGRGALVRVLLVGLALAAGLARPVAAQPAAWSWGDNTYGQLGDGTTTKRNLPGLVSGLSSVVSVSAGKEHAAAATSDGKVWTWGANYNGQLGNGTVSGGSTTSPGLVNGIGGVVAVSAGQDHTLALKGDGTTWAWGWNYEGRLGDGTTTTRLEPVAVKNLTGIVAISAGGGHSLALRNDGTAWAWGGNYTGRRREERHRARCHGSALHVGGGDAAGDDPVRQRLEAERVPVPQRRHRPRPDVRG